MENATSALSSAQEETRVDKMNDGSISGDGAPICVASVFSFGAPSFLLRGTSYDENINNESSNSKEEGNDYDGNEEEVEEAEEEEEDNKSGGNLIGYWLEGDSLAPPCQADMRVVDSIIEFAGLNETSKLIDLGCGDGRICLRASLRFNCQAWGCEIEENLVQKFRAYITSLHLSERVFCIQGDLCEIDYSSYSVIVIYLLPEAIELIKKKLFEALDKNEGTVLICNTWGPKGWTPIERRSCGRFKNVSLIKYDKRSLPRGSEEL